MAIVNLLIGGAQKAGTTALHAILSQNPQVYLHPKKELHFFDRDQNFGDMTENPSIFSDYESQFAVGLNATWIGEATPSYMWADRAAERIASYNPKMKWIVCLRDPKWRALSQWRMQRELGTVDLSFEESLAREIRLLFKDQRTYPGSGYISRGMYAAQIERLFRLFGRTNVLVLIYDRFVETFECTMKDIDRFLFGGIEHRYSNEFVGTTPADVSVGPELISLLNEIFKKDVDTLEKRLGIDLANWKHL